MLPQTWCGCVSILKKCFAYSNINLLLSALRMIMNTIFSSRGRIASRHQFGQATNMYSKSHWKVVQSCYSLVMGLREPIITIE